MEWSLPRLLASWKKIALTTLLALLFGQTYIWLATPMYTSRAALLIEPDTRKIHDVAQAGIGQNVTFVENQAAIMTSDGVLKKVVDTLNLSGDPEFASEKSPLMRAIAFALVPGQMTASLQDRARAHLKKALKVSRAENTYVLDIAATTAHPEKSASIVAAVIEAYVADQTNNAAAKRAKEPIEFRLAELRDQVREAELRANAAKNSPKILDAEGGVIDDQKVTRLSTERDGAHSAAAESKARRDQIQAAIKSGAEPDVSSEAARSELIPRLREQYAEVARRAASLSSQLQPSHPDIIDIRSQLRAVKAEITAELKRVATAAESAYQVAANRETELTHQLDKAKQDVAVRNTAQIRERELEHEHEHEIAASRERLKNYQDRANETQEQKTMQTWAARVISAPLAPSAPSKPIPLFVLAFSLIAGLATGILWALRATKSDEKLASTGQLIERTGVQSVSVIPRFQKPFGTSLGDRTYGPYSDLIAALDPTSTREAAPYQQAVLRLLSKIRTTGRVGRPNTVMFTSPRPGVGNSASILAVAYKAAVSGERVLLVDATSTNPDLSSIFAADISKSANNILDNKEQLNKIVMRDARSGLSFLPIALVDLRTLRVQQRRRLVAGLNLLSQDYDWVFIDAGSLLNDEAASTLLPATDSVFLVVRTGDTSRSDINEMLQMLEPARERIAGAILTVGTA